MRVMMRRWLSNVMGLSFAILLAMVSPAIAETDYVDAAEKWFAKITTMKARFTQVGSDGSVAEGELHLRRPHRMKIIYDSDEPLILLTTPVWLHVDRPERKNVTSYPISETPLSLILRGDEYQTQSDLRDGIVSIRIDKKTGNAAGTLTLEFTAEPFELRRWTIKDATDVTTVVTLQNMRYGHKYRNEFFAQPLY